MDNRVYVSIDAWSRKIWQNKKGEYHRLDGPAIESSNGGKEWWEYGKLHRLSGPAIECANGGKSWYQNGFLHRLDGPAVIYGDGEKCWYKNGYKFESKDKFFEALTEEEKQIALFSEDFLNG